jgi:energy-converting hydrogenase Eha subunit C
MNWTQLSTGIRYFLVGMIGLISATDVIPSNKIKLYTLVLSGAIIALKAIDISLGAKTDMPEK